MSKLDKFFDNFGNKKETNNNTENTKGNLAGGAANMLLNGRKIKAKFWGFTLVAALFVGYFVIAFVSMVIVGPLYADDKKQAELWSGYDDENYTAYQQEIVDIYGNNPLDYDMSTDTFNEETQEIYYQRLNEAYIQYLTAPNIGYVEEEDTDGDGLLDWVWNGIKNIWQWVKDLFTPVVSGEKHIPTRQSYGVEIDARLITSTLYAERFLGTSLDQDEQVDFFVGGSETDETLTEEEQNAWKYRNLHSIGFRDETEKQYLEDANQNLKSRTMLAINGIEILSKYLIKRTETYLSVDDYTEFEFHDTTRNIDVKYMSLMDCVEETLASGKAERLCNGSCDAPQPISVGEFEVSSGGEWNFYVCAERRSGSNATNNNNESNSETLSLAMAFEDYCLTGNCSSVLAIDTTSTCPPGVTCPFVTPTPTPDCSTGQCGAPVYTGPSEKVQGFTSDPTGGDCLRWKVVDVPECPVEYADDSNGKHGEDYISPHTGQVAIDFIRYDIDCETYEKYIYQEYPLERHITAFNAQETYKTKFTESYYHEYLGDKEKDPEEWERKFQLLVRDNIFGMNEFYQNAEKHYSVCLGGSGVNTTGDISCHGGLASFKDNNYDSFVPETEEILQEVDPEVLEELLAEIPLNEIMYSREDALAILNKAIELYGEGKSIGDCKVFVREVYKKAGITLPEGANSGTSETMSNFLRENGYFTWHIGMGTEFNEGDCQPGDLLFFVDDAHYSAGQVLVDANNNNSHHVAIYAGGESDSGRGYIYDTTTKNYKPMYREWSYSNPPYACARVY